MRNSSNNLEKEAKITDKELVKGCIKGNRKLQEQLYRTYASKMYSICLSYANRREEGMDILQEGFVKVFRQIKTFKFQGSLEGWIRRIIVRTAIDHFRKYKEERDLSASEFLEVEDGRSLSALENMALEDLMGYLQKLPEGARVVFNLYAIEGYNHREIAELINISEGTSKSQYSRAKGLLQSWIMEEQTEEL
ncbi:RNA polymerase sigma factor [Echinicola jeungdonensis]|uniref:RNA polymerase sigma factor n=1 Tax=Echinicola jeungdonensis TaxID=709343 RepID=A0ABV5J6E4_9BACT|nr:RNA polymerase sigma factor [Echinicola jeungdonensis]MDN3668084.1 RNA polymerase sigma factor [Echinicola jeungdonensis]